MRSYSYRLYGMRVIADLEFPQLCKVRESGVMLMPKETGNSGRNKEDTYNRKGDCNKKDSYDRINGIRESTIYKNHKNEKEELQVIIRKMSETEQRRFSEEHGEGVCISRIGTEESSLSNSTLQMSVLRGKEIRYRCRDGADPGHLRTYLLGFGMAMLTLQRGMLPFHCSALKTPEGGAVLIAGESGAGKSTLTANLLRQGYGFLADDMAVVDSASVYGGKANPVVFPAFPYLKLCRDAVLRQGLSPEKLRKVEETKAKKDKFLVPYTGEFRTEGVPVKLFVLLGKNTEKNVRVEKITGLNSMLVYKENLFLRHLWKKRRPEAAVEQEVWQRCLEMAEKVPVYYVERATAGDSTAEVAAEVHKLLRS